MRPPILTFPLSSCPVEFYRRIEMRGYSRPLYLGFNLKQQRDCFPMGPVA